MSQISLFQQPTDVNRVYATRSLLLCFATLGLGLAFFIAEHSFSPGSVENSLEQLESGSHARRVGFVSVGLLGCLLLSVSRGRRFAFNNSLSVVLGLYVGLCLASLIWADHTDMSSKRLLVSFLCLLGVIGICRHFSPLDLCRMVLIISFVYLCIGVFVEVTGVAHSASPGRYRFGGTLHMNAQAVNCAFICICSACLFRDATRWRWALVGMFLVALVCLLLTGSRGALYSLLFATATYWWLNSSGHKRALGLTVFPALATFLMLISLMFGVEPDQLMDISQLGRERATISTMTGRFPLWNELLAHVQTRPILGYGYQAFWNLDRYAELAASRDWIPTHSHSAYMESILSLGIVGAFLFVLAIFIGICQAYKHVAHTGDAGYKFALVVLLMVPIYSISESRYAAPSCFYSTVFYCALFHLAFCADPLHRSAQRSDVATRMRFSRNAPVRSNA